MRRLLAATVLVLGAALLLAPAATAAPAATYTVQVADATARPGSLAPVVAIVRTAAGRPAAGVPVLFGLAGATATAVTGADGLARGSIVAPATAEVLTASVVGAVPARAAFVPALRPAPRLTLGVAAPLVLAGGTVAPVVTVTGTYGFPATGAVEAVGPVVAPAGGCAGASYAGAAIAWTGTFAVTADGRQPVAGVPSLGAGCYAVRAVLATTDVTPAVTVRAPAVVVAVSAVTVTESVGSGFAALGPLTATVSATGGRATLATAVTAYGPLAPGPNGCAGLTWTTAAGVPGGSGSSTARSAPVTRPGCYSLATRTTVTQDGLATVVTTAPGATGTVVRVLAPSVTVTDDAYDGRQGVPMTGTVHVSGTSGLTGRVSVGLREITASAGDCRAAGATATTAVTPAGQPAGSVLAVHGDGDYPFRTAAPTANRCYAVTATLVLAADGSLTATASPGPTSVFLAGATTQAPTAPRTQARGSNRTTHEVAVLGAGAGAVLLVALGMLVTGAVAGERRPDPAARALLADLGEGAAVGSDAERRR